MRWILISLVTPIWWLIAEPAPAATVTLTLTQTQIDKITEVCAAYDRLIRADTPTPVKKCFLDLFRRSALDIVAKDKRRERTRSVEQEVRDVQIPVETLLPVQADRPICGDDELDAGEACDEGAAMPTATCDACQVP